MVVAYLLEDKRPLEEFVDEHCGWVLLNLVEQKASTVGEWCDLINEISPWETEVECRAFLDRVRPTFEETAIFEVYEDEEGKWDIAMFDSRWAHWHTIWKYCQEHGIEFEDVRENWYAIWHHCTKRGIEFNEAWKAFLDGKLEELLDSKGAIELVAA